MLDWSKEDRTWEPPRKVALQIHHFQLKEFPAKKFSPTVLNVQFNMGHKIVPNPEGWYPILVSASRRTSVGQSLKGFPGKGKDLSQAWTQKSAGAWSLEQEENVSIIPELFV